MIVFQIHRPLSKQDLDSIGDWADSVGCAKGSFLGPLFIVEASGKAFQNKLTTIPTGHCNVTNMYTVREHASRKVAQ